MVLTQEKIEDIKNQLQGLEGDEQQKKLQEILATLSPEDRDQLVKPQKCPFCMMADGEIPTQKIFEDDKILGILDHNPANKGHVLLFPKEHASLTAQIPDSVTAHMFTIANKISSACFEAMQADGTNIIVANGSVAGQTAPHALINIIPRFEGDKVALGWQGQKMEENELAKIAEKIKAVIPKPSVGTIPIKTKLENLNPDDLPREITRIP
jgi:histidine triad (HIT) family protein